MKVDREENQQMFPQMPKNEHGHVNDTNKEDAMTLQKECKDTSISEVKIKSLKCLKRKLKE